jgi:preprotein translocase subunit SecB
MSSLPPDAQPARAYNEEKQPGIQLAQVFLEAVEFSHNGDVLALPVNTKPNVGTVNIGVEIAVSTDEKAGYIRLTVATTPEASPVYNVKVTMVALLQVAEQPNLPLREFLITAGVPTLYPFMREAFANITQRGRFGPVWLNLINTKKVSDDLRVKGFTDRVPEPSDSIPKALSQDPAAQRGLSSPERSEPRRPSGTLRKK